MGALLELDAPVAIVPDRHGTGTNALLLAPPDVIAPSFGPGSFDRHVAAARDAGVEYAVARISALMFDVDTPDDLADLSAALDERRGQAASTRGRAAPARPLTGTRVGHARRACLGLAPP